MIELLKIIIFGLSAWNSPAETKPEISCIETAVEIGAVAVSNADDECTFVFVEDLNIQEDE